jgi:hypothetical protein
MILSKYSLGVLMTVVLAACAVFTVPNIETSIVVPVAPANGIKTVTQTQTFFWNYIDGADGYDLQIVSPRFDSIAQFILDTNIIKNSFVYTLLPGHYEWWVIGYNSAYTTMRNTIFSLTITIDSTDNLANQKVVLQSPENNIYTNDVNVQFKWDLLTMAIYYIVDVRDVNFSGSNIYNHSETEKDTIELTLSEGRFSWGVQAHNDVSTTVFSTRLITVDLTPPNAPVITVPANDDDTLSSPFLIKWTSSDALSPMNDSIYVSADSLFKAPTGYQSNDNELDVSDSPNGKYYVKIKSIDLAGNKSVYSAVRKFYLP